MANPYKRIWDANPSIDSIKLPEDMLEAPIEDCTGRQILVRAFALAGGVPTFPHLFAAFTEVQFTRNWVWNPSSGGGSNPYGLLDGTKLSGECLHFAKNLWFLARAPAPYGLGLARDVVTTSKYEGATGNGFVAAHNGTFLTLRPNIVAAQGYQGTPLYSWGDHKTVRWNNLFWDPCYVTTYAAEANMAVYQGTNVTVRTDDDGLLPTGPTGLTLLNQGKAAEKATLNGRIFYFRQVGTHEGRGAHIRYEGPISETKLELIRSAARGIRITR